MGISTHILDTALGRPAANVPVKLLEFRDDAAGGSWHEIGSAFTGHDGRAGTLLGNHPLIASDYPALYPYVEIVFTVADPSQHYHIPLLLTANGYTTYRGS
jgi:5-hydroxyisourate hydrolase